MKATLPVIGLVAASLLGAADMRVVADVPFPFYVNGKQMPAGRYAVTQRSTSVLQVMSASESRLAPPGRSRAALVVALSVPGRLSEPSRPELLFRAYRSGRYFLGGVRRYADGSSHFDIPISRLERERVTSTYDTAQTIAIPASAY